jgi:O-antigen ligase
MPFVSFKRWVKILAHPVMALVILTDPDPVGALRSVFRKVGYLVLPLSLLFIRYYPAIGRSYDYWTGVPFLSGVTTMKNSLGCLCYIFAVFFFWECLMAWKVRDRKIRNRQLAVGVGFLVLSLYLLHLAQSATSQACFILGAAALLVFSTRLVNPRYLGASLLLALAIGIISESLFGIREAVIHMLGRSTDLTERTHLWAALSSISINPVLGAGFESFWTGERMAALTARGYGFGQAHNGYLETYLNLGVVGLGILVASLVAGFTKIRGDLITQPSLGRFELAFLITIIAYNYTEAAFKATQPLWTIFCLIAIRCEFYRRRLLSRRNIRESQFGGIASATVPTPVGAGYASYGARPATL